VKFPLDVQLRVWTDTGTADDGDESRNIVDNPERSLNDARPNETCTAPEAWPDLYHL
jgi:hypothetical protein